MAVFALYSLAWCIIASLTRSEAQQTLQFSSYSQIPQSLLDGMTSEERENMRQALQPTTYTQQISGGQGGGSGGQMQGGQGGGSGGQMQEIGGTVSGGKPGQPTTYTQQISGGQGGGSGGQMQGGQGGGSEEIGGTVSGRKPGQTLQFSSYSQIPQSLLDNMSSSERESIRSALQQRTYTQQIPGWQGGESEGQMQGGQGGGSRGQMQELGGTVSGRKPGQIFQFSSYSQIPQSLLDNMSSSERESIRNALKQRSYTQQIPAQHSQTQSKTYRFPGTNAGQTLQFSSYSQIPQSLLEEMSSDERENIRMALQPSTYTRQIPAQPAPRQSSNAGNIPTFHEERGNIRKSRKRPDQRAPEGTDQTLEFSMFSEIPESILEEFPSSEQEDIERTLDGFYDSNTYTLPGGDNPQINNLVNVIYNFVSAGGYLTGIPPIDLLLLRFYLNENPKKFC